MKKHSLLLVLGILIISLVMIGCDNGSTDPGGSSGGGSTPALTIAGKTGLSVALSIRTDPVFATVIATEVTGSGTEADPWEIFFKDGPGDNDYIMNSAKLVEYFNINAIAGAPIDALESFFTITNGDDAKFGRNGSGVLFDTTNLKGTIISNGVTYHLILASFT